MNFYEKNPPRKFDVGMGIVISDCGSVHLDKDEQLTFVNEAGKEHDFTAKSWGFYSTPSINGRLRDQGFKTALVMNRKNKVFIMVVDTDKLEEFHDYLAQEDQNILEWLDERG